MIIEYGFKKNPIQRKLETEKDKFWKIPDNTAIGVYYLA